MHSHSMNFPVYDDLTPAAIATYHLGSTPETIVVSPAGRVLKSWSGAFVGDTKNSVERFFGLTFQTLALEPSS